MRGHQQGGVDPRTRLGPNATALRYRRQVAAPARRQGWHLRLPSRAELLVLTVGMCLFLAGLLLPLWHVQARGPELLRTAGVLCLVATLLMRLWAPKPSAGEAAQREP